MHIHIHIHICIHMYVYVYLSARFAQRAEQARAYSGEGRHSEEWGWSFGRPAH